MVYFAGHILRKSSLSPTVTLLDLTIPRLSSFHPGQWIDFRIPSQDWIGGFSITSSVADLPQLRIAVKSSSHPPSHWITHTSQPGDPVSVQLGGTCVLHPAHTHTPAVFLAGGIGIAPLLPMYRQQVAERRTARNRFFYSVSRESEFVFREELADLAEQNRDELVVTLTQQPEWADREALPRAVVPQTGRTMRAFLERTPAEAVYYLCGPPRMQEEAITLLQQRGIPSGQLVYEKWW